jgi:hypothetical protein
VVTGQNDDQLIIGHAVDETMLVVDPPRPEPGEVAPQRLRLSNTLERGPSRSARCGVDPT